ncbi:toll/interleukin-1 receptor domain-containing protein [Affinirhizobium pseudoryzae]|uniref:toll/interleukin-1 receptor domain-containing protein n=1 Tax=Allorhizobium pseudoryzae TaxID=379684 RepID=UPI0013EC2CC7|nr:toll/interleukin-1 receptor domain-containing protein [Allorhizobium pseudoryzae]
MAEMLLGVADIASRETLEAYLRTRPISEAQVLALRSALRVMPLIALNRLPDRRHTQELMLAVFRTLFFSWAARNDSAHEEKLASVAASFAAKATSSSVSAAAAIAAAAEAARAAVGPGAFAAAARAVDLAATAADLAAGANGAVGRATRTDLENMRENSVPACIATPLWPNGGAPIELSEWDVAFSAVLDDFGSHWGLVADFYYALHEGQASLATLWSEAGTAAVAEEVEAFWRQDPDAVMRDLGWRLKHNQPLMEYGSASSSASANFDFFISYSTRNQTEAREINRYLEDAGYSTIVQFKDFPVGSNFVIEMQDGLERGARAIALLSPDYVASDHCRAEWAAVYNMDPLGKGRKLVPLLLKPANLNTLARQIVYKSLVGLTAEERRAAVLEAVGPKPNPLPPDMLKRRLAETASPDVAPTPDGKLDAVPNAIYDRPIFDAELPDLPETLRTLCSVIQASLPENSPKTIAPSLQAYGNHLSDRGVRPILGLLCMLADALNRDVRSVEFHIWGDGLAVHFDNFFSCHSKYVTHFPKSQEREEALATNEIDEDRASGKDFVEPVKKVAEALADLHEIGGTTPAFERVVQDSVQRARDIDSLPSPSDAGQGGDVTPKRRFVFSQIGFWERILSALGSMTTLATTEQGRAAIATLREAIAKFLSFLSSN